MRTSSEPCGPQRSESTLQVGAVVGLDLGVAVVDGAHARVDEVRDAEEVGHERGLRALVEVGRAAGLLDLAAVHHRDRVGHGHGLLLVVRDVHEGDPDVLLDPLELDLQLLAQAQVERAERLVEQQRARAVDQRAGERDALLLAAGELRRACAWPGGRAGRAPARRTRACGPRPWRPSCARGRTRRSSRRSGAGTARRTERRC